MNRNYRKFVIPLAVVASLLLGFLIFKQINFFSAITQKDAPENSISAEYLKGMIAKGDLDYKNSKESFESFFELEKNQANLSKVPLVVQYNLMKLSILADNLPKALIYANSLYKEKKEFSDDFLTLIVLAIAELDEKGKTTIQDNKTIGENANYDFSFKLKPAYSVYLEKLFNSNTTKEAKFSQNLVINFYFKEITPLVKAWLNLGKLNKEQAIKAIELENNSSIKPIGDKNLYKFHRALIYQITGDAKKAESQYRQIDFKNCSSICVNSFVSFLNKIGKGQEAKLLSENPKFKEYSWNADRPMFEYEDNGFTVIRFALYDVISNYANIAFAFEHYADAEVLYHLMLLIYPESSLANSFLGRIYSLINNPEKAILFFEKIKPNSLYGQESIAEIAYSYAKLGDFSRAEKLLKTSSVNNASLVSILKIAEIYMEKEKYNKALNLLNRIIEEKKEFGINDWIVFYQKGVVLDKMGKWLEAKENLLKALKFSPEEPTALNYLAYRMLELNEDVERAEKLLLIALSKNPENPYIIDSYGFALYKLGDYENAVKFLEKANLLAPQELDISEHLGDAYWKLGRQKEARFEWFRIHQISKDAKKRRELKDKINNGI